MTDETPASQRARKRRYIGTHVFLLSCTALVVSFFVWSTKGTLDVVSVTAGEVVPASKVKSIQHLEGGIIREIMVREGDVVVKNQPLVILEPIKSTSEVDELKVRLTSFRIQMAMLNGLLTNQTRPKFSADLIASEPALVDQSASLFRSRRTNLTSLLRMHSEKIEQRKQEIKEVGVRRRNNAISLKLVREQIGISNKLLKLELTNRMQHLNFLREEAALVLHLEEDEAALPRVKSALIEAREKLTSTKAEFEIQTRNELAIAQRTFNELTQRMRKFEDSLRRTVLRAPEDGVVKSLYSFTEGGVIRAGSTVLDIVPAGNHLVIEARLPPQDIGYVQIGQPAVVRLASADAARLGDLMGEVILVSPDTLLTNDGIPYYKIRIKTEKNYFERGDLRYKLFPGMQVQCSIQTGSRTVLEYILDPYMGSIKNAMSER